MNIIIFTHHLSTWAGSETVCLELIEEFQSRGHNVRVVSPFASPSFVHLATQDWNILLRSFSQLDDAPVDLLVVLHQGLSRLSEAEFETLFSMQHRPFIAYFHLSPFEPFEAPGPFVQKALADVIYANSEETRHELASFGLDGVELFQNPAPAAFEAEPRSKGPLKTLLSVSNHLPHELADAFDILRKDGIDVRRIGAPNQARRVRPDDVMDCDALVTIGKTVQFGLRSRRPVYCYDHFQGPGWLAPWTQSDEDLNFSGRSQRSALSPDQIANAIKQGFPDAHRWVSGTGADTPARFKLEVFVDHLLERVTAAGQDRAWPDWTKGPDWRPQVRTERVTHDNVDRFYARANKVPLPASAAPLDWGKQYTDRITQHMLRDPSHGEPKVIAVFSFRYDADLVDGLIENISPFVHGYAALDDRGSVEYLTNESERQMALYKAAEDMGADWIFVADPDERYEDALADKMPHLTSDGGPVIWTMNCREMFSETQYRYDGIWSNRPRQRLFPCYPGMEPSTDRLHGHWTRNAHKLPVKPSGIEFFHLRMATPERRTLRRQLYAASDPDRAFQDVGYDYIDDERGMKLRTLSNARKFSPRHVEDGGLWAPSTAQIGRTEPKNDPLPHSIRRATNMREMLGYENAMHTLLDLVAKDPSDCEIALLAAECALKAGSADVAAKICLDLQNTQAEPLFALSMLAEAYIGLGDFPNAEATIEKIDALCPKFDSSSDLKARLKRRRDPDALSGPDALWRRWLVDDVDGTQSRIHLGANVPDAQIAVVVIAMGGDLGLAKVVAALREQSIVAEIVVVNSNGGSARQTLAQHLDFIRVIDVEERLFAGAARNIGIDATTAEFVAFISSDCIPTAGCLEDRLNAHLDGYNAVPSTVLPQHDVSHAGMAIWLWLYSARLEPTSLTAQGAYSLSYSRRLFQQYGYFPSGARIGEDTLLNDRFRTKVEVALGLDISLLHSFETDPTGVAKDIQARTRRRTFAAQLGKDVPLDQIRFLARSRAENRLRTAKKALDNVRFVPLKETALISQALDNFAKLEEQEAVQASQNILNARELMERAEDAMARAPDEAYAEMAQAIEIWPNSLKVLFTAAKCASRSSQPDIRDAAVNLALQAFSCNPDAKDAVGAMSFAMNLLVERKQFQRAYAELRRAVVMNPKSVGLLMLARLLPGPGFRPIRAMYFQKAFAVAPWAPQPNVQIINYHKQMGDHAAAQSRKRTFETFSSL